REVWCKRARRNIRLAHAPPGGSQPRRQVLEHLMRLPLDVPLADDLSRRVDGRLSRDEEQAASGRLHALAVTRPRIEQRRRLDGDSIHVTMSPINEHRTEDGARIPLCG